MSTNARAMELTETRLLGRRVICRQPKTGFRVAIDAVFLAAAVPAHDGDTALELGSGCGAAALCLAARVPTVNVVGVEVQPDLVAVAAENAALNGLKGRVRFVCGNLMTPPPDGAEPVYDHVFANPPYMKAGTGQVPRNPAKNRATIEGDARLRDWLRVAMDQTRPGGTMTIVHRFDRLSEIIALLDPSTDGIAVLPLIPHPGGAAKRVLVQVTKGRAGPILHLPGLILHETRRNGAGGNGTGENKAGRAYTMAAEAVLRDAAPLSITEPNHVED